MRMCILMKGGSMKTFLKKILMVLAGKKSIMAKRHNTQPETYCEMVRREKLEEEIGQPGMVELKYNRNNGTYREVP